VVHEEQVELSPQLVQPAIQAKKNKKIKTEKQNKTKKPIDGIQQTNEMKQKEIKSVARLLLLLLMMMDDDDGYRVTHLHSCPRSSPHRSPRHRNACIHARLCSNTKSPSHYTRCRQCQKKSTHYSQEGPPSMLNQRPHEKQGKQKKK
jgi:hypothetical protein